MGPRIPLPSEHPQDLEPEGGYLIENGNVYFKNIDTGVQPSDLKSLTCGICSRILKDPIQLISCGCRYCSACIHRITASISRTSSFNCPYDGEVFTLRQIRKDKGCMKEIEQLEADCQAIPSCSWRGPLAMLEQHHSEECPNSLVSCKSKCGQEFLRCHKGEHDLECVKREVDCTHCSARVPHDELEDHHTSCPFHPVSCDFCAQVIPQRREFARHLDEVCTECELNCPMAKSLQCRYKGKRTQLTQHVTDSHFLNVMEKMGQLVMRVEALESSNVELVKKMEEKDEIIDELEKKLENVERLVIKQKGVISRMKSEDYDSHSVTSTSYSKFDSCHRCVGNACMTRSGGRVLSRSPSSQTGYEPNNSLEGVSYDKMSPNAVTHMLRETVERHGNQIAHLHEGMQSLQQNITKYSISMDEMRLRQDVQDVRTTHGIFIWKIPDIRRRYRDALEGKTVSLYSPPFQTSPHGYRMCIRVYLNGDGTGKGTYISLFFVLMRSEHDNLLVFPFRQSVRFTLINQVTRMESITEAFAPDLQSKSFQQPQSDMNVASGFPRFARQSVLHDEKFTRGNAIYIKAKVDLSGLTQE